MKNPSQQNYISQVSIDCVIFGYHERQLKVLIPKLNFKGDFWALPAGFVYQDEDIDRAAKRILQERTSIKDIYLEQFHVFGNASRNNKAFLDQLIASNPHIVVSKNDNQREYEWFTQRFISIGYYALVDINKVIPQKIDLDHSI